MPYDIRHPLVKRYLDITSKKSQKWGEIVLTEMCDHSGRLKKLCEQKDSNPDEIIRVVRRMKVLAEKLEQAKRNWKEFKQLEKTEAVQEFLKSRANFEEEEAERRKGLHTF